MIKLKSAQINNSLKAKGTKSNSITGKSLIAILTRAKQDERKLG